MNRCRKTITYLLMGAAVLAASVPHSVLAAGGAVSGSQTFGPETAAQAAASSSQASMTVSYTVAADAHWHDVPETPDQPVNPDNPVTPDNPVAPDTPITPVTPVTPSDNHGGITPTDSGNTVSDAGTSASAAAAAAGNISGRGNYYIPADSSDRPVRSITHTVGTYIVTIPTNITYVVTKAGQVNVNATAASATAVRGALTQMDEVELTAEASEPVSRSGEALAPIGPENGQDEMTISMNRTHPEYTAEEVYGNSTDGTAHGTTFYDDIVLSGTAADVETYTARVVYTARIMQR